MNSPINKPKRLYKYLPINTQTLENIKSQIIYFGSPLNFNDPFDCALFPTIMPICEAEVRAFREDYLADQNLPSNLRNGFNSMDDDELKGIISRSADNALHARIELFQRNNGVSCFSQWRNNLLMWSHYADKCRGICLEFDTSYEPFSKMRKVKYCSKFPIINIAKAVRDPESEEIINLFATKSRDWTYEKEWRVLHGESNTKYHYEAKALTGIYFGPDINPSILEIICLILKGQNEHVKFWRGTRSTKTFSVEFSPFTYTSNIDARKAGLL